MTHASNASSDSWGRPADAPTGYPGTDGAATGSGRRTAGKRRGNKAVKILVTVVVVILLLLAAAEFGLRFYLKGQIADEMRDSSAEQGIELSGDPDVSFGASPMLLGLAQGKLSRVTVDLPSSLDISYEDSDRSRPVVTGQPAATMNAKDMEITGDDPVIGDLTLDTVLPQDYLLAVLQKSMSQEGGDQAADDGGAGDLLSGLIQITGVTTNEETGTLEIEISSGLATLSMTPTVTDGKMSFEVADMKILGMSMPDSLVGDLSDSLTQTIEETENLEVTDASVTADGLKVRLHGTDMKVDDLASEVDASTDATLAGA
ncbi:MAG TPA: DUF2993 domain-containing protein [Corynebacterium variabile]|uniref:LmeA family phospholipid-binding protein n=1 Tax=Corynebacterium variabile TaxID=1727 RepID=UPI000EE58F76|nr:DUF2993 domain-containing protein [Corynebacterium variabile]HAJ52132.1 DUF2993 domain-containing protein [Corynebacterium variabile]